MKDWLKGNGLTLILMVVVGFLIYDRVHQDHTGTQVIDASALGLKFQHVLAGSLADGFEAGADVIEKGGKVAEADNVLKAKFQESRQAAFSTQVAPVFAAVLPDGAEPKDDAQRAEFARLWRTFAKGLRSKRGL